MRYVNSATVGKNASSSHMAAYGVQQELSGSTFLGSITVDVKQTQSFTSTHTWESALTTTDTLTKALSVTGPGCPQTGPPYVPTYTGPGTFTVYQDNLYGTFMVLPV